MSNWMKEKEENIILYDQCHLLEATKSGKHVDIAIICCLKFEGRVYASTIVTKARTPTLNGSTSRNTIRRPVCLAAALMRIRRLSCRQVSSSKLSRILTKLARTDSI